MTLEKMKEDHLVVGFVPICRFCLSFCTMNEGISVRFLYRSIDLSHPHSHLWILID